MYRKLVVIKTNKLPEKNIYISVALLLYYILMFLLKWVWSDEIIYNYINSNYKTLIANKLLSIIEEC